MIDSITHSVITQSLTALYSKDLKVKDLADICNIDVRFRKIHRKPPLPDSLFNEVAGHQPATLLQKKPLHRRFPVNFVNFLRAPFLKNSSGRLLLTLQVHKVDENLSRYCNKNIKVMSIEALLVTLCQL